jgi:small subunit ribosomal protein SAe
MASSGLELKEEDLKLMLAANVHIGTKNMNCQMSRYIWRRRRDGVYLINLGMTWEKLILAARIIVAIENPEDIIAISARPYGQRAVFKFAQHTGAQYIGGRYTPGTFSNQDARDFKEPRLLIVTDPLADHQPIKEASYVNVPTIGFADADAPLTHVDLAIPGSTKGKQSIGLLYWLLAREVLRMRAMIARTEPWNVIVDLFLHREPEDTDKKGDEVEAADQVVLEQEQAAFAEPLDEQAVPKINEWANQEEQAPVGGAMDQWNPDQAPASGNAQWAPADAPSGWDGGLDGDAL